MLKKLLFNIRLFFHGLFYGLRSADTKISTETHSNSDEYEFLQEKHTDSVYGDLVAGKETQEVKELRDEYYRTLIESKNYHTDVIGSFDEGDESPLVAVTRKKTALDFVCKIDLYNPEKLPVRVIQDVKLIQNRGNFFAEDLFKYSLNDFVSNIEIERDFLPRFNIENYANKVVVRKIDENNVYVDFYTTMYASQFGKVDAIYISQLNTLYREKTKRSDITDIKRIRFITDKAYGENDLCEFVFENVRYHDINEFDGNFVLTFKCKCVSEGKSIVEKYKTKELDEKLKKHAVRDSIKKSGVDIFTLNRNIEKEEINLQTQKINIQE